MDSYTPQVPHPRHLIVLHECRVVLVVRVKGVRHRTYRGVLRAFAAGTLGLDRPQPLHHSIGRVLRNFSANKAACDGHPALLEERIVEVCPVEGLSMAIPGDLDDIESRVLGAAGAVNHGHRCIHSRGAHFGRARGNNNKFERGVNRGEGLRKHSQTAPARVFMDAMHPRAIVARSPGSCQSERVETSPSGPQRQ